MRVTSNARRSTWRPPRSCRRGPARPRHHPLPPSAANHTLQVAASQRWATGRRTLWRGQGGRVCARARRTKRARRWGGAHRRRRAPALVRLGQLLQVGQVVGAQLVDDAREQILQLFGLGVPADNVRVGGDGRLHCARRAREGRWLNLWPNGGGCKPAALCPQLCTPRPRPTAVAAPAAPSMQCRRHNRREPRPRADA